MTQYELESRWITADGIAGVSYRFGDLVLIKSGANSGQRAEVVSLLSSEPEPVYVVELLNTECEVVSESALEPTGSTSGRPLKLKPPGSLPF